MDNIEQFEITEERYHRVVYSLLVAAGRLAAYHRRHHRDWVSREYFMTTSYVPSVFHRGSDLPCTLTGEVLANHLPLPETFHWWPRCNTGIWHFSPKGCPGLTTEDMVICVAHKIPSWEIHKFYLTRHKVGSCPHKLAPHKLAFLP